MKCTTVINPNRDEEIVIYVKRRHELVERVEALCREECGELLGYDAGEIVRLSPDEVEAFCVRDGRIYAICAERDFVIKERLYTLESRLVGFVKINQSCLANIKHISRFRTSFGGSLSVIFRSGYTDYVSRRQLKALKEAVGIRGGEQRGKSGARNEE